MSSLLVMAFMAAPTAATETFVCPPRPVAAARWTLGELKATSGTTVAEVSADAPPSLAIEAPNDDIEGVHSWRLPEDTPFYVVCRYQELKTVTYRRVPDRLRFCRATYRPKLIRCAATAAALATLRPKRR